MSILQDYSLFSMLCVKCILPFFFGTKLPISLKIKGRGGQNRETKLPFGRVVSAEIKSIDLILRRVSAASLATNSKMARRRDPWPKLIGFASARCRLQLLGDASKRPPDFDPQISRGSGTMPGISPRNQESFSWKQTRQIIESTRERPETDETIPTSGTGKA